MEYDPLAGRFGFFELHKAGLFLRDRLLRSPSAPLKFGYIGAHQKGNLGDDVLFIAACRLLAGSDVLTYGPPRLESLLSAVGRSGPNYLNSLILGGGTLINPIWTEQVRGALAKGIPVWSLGTGVGSCGFEQPWEIELEAWPELLNQFQSIGVRGPRSKKALEDLGFRTSEVIGDLALSLARDRPHAAPARPRLGVNITIPQSRRAEDYATLRRIGALANRLEKEGWDIVPIIFHPGDIAPTRDVLAGLPIDPKNFATPRDLNKLWPRLGSCTLTIAGRLHAAVLSCCAGVPSLKIAYRDKCLDFMDSMELSDWRVPLESECEGKMTGTADSTIDQVVDRALGVAADRSAEIREEVWSRARNWKAITEAYVKRNVELSRA